jgi:hypothetical protein
MGAGTLVRDFKHLALDMFLIEEEGQKKLRVEISFGKRKTLAAIRTCCSHVMVSVGVLHSGLEACEGPVRMGSLAPEMLTLPKRPRIGAGRRTKGWVLSAENLKAAMGECAPAHDSHSLVGATKHCQGS